MIDLDALEREMHERWTGNAGVADGNRILFLIAELREARVEIERLQELLEAARGDAADWQKAYEDAP